MKRHSTIVRRQMLARFTTRMGISRWNTVAKNHTIALLNANDSVLMLLNRSMSGFDAKLNPPS